MLKKLEWLMGNREKPKGKLRFYGVDGCQWGDAHPGDDDTGAPYRKKMTWIANFPLDLIALRCQDCVAALVPCTHHHKELRGRMDIRHQGKKGVSVAAASANVTAELAAGYATEVERFCKRIVTPCRMPDGERRAALPPNGACEDGKQVASDIPSPTQRAVGSRRC